MHSSKELVLQKALEKGAHALRAFRGSCFSQPARNRPLSVVGRLAGCRRLPPLKPPRSTSRISTSSRPACVRLVARSAPDTLNALCSAISQPDAVSRGLSVRPTAIRRCQWKLEIGEGRGVQITFDICASFTWAGKRFRVRLFLFSFDPSFMSIVVVVRAAVLTVPSVHNFSFAVKS